MTASWKFAVCGLGLAVAACSTESGGLDDGLITVSVSGSIVDFQTGEPVEAALVTEGLLDGHTISVTGSAFEIDNITGFSVFHVLSTRPPDFRNTFNRAVEVEDRDLTDVTVEVLSEQYVGELTAAFGVTPAAGTGVLLVRVVDEAGEPLAGVPANAFELNELDPPDGPHFLDADRAPAPQLNQTSASGYAVFFDVAPGLVSVNAAGGSGVTLAMALSPTAAATATVADAVFTNGELQLPTNVSFAGDVTPIFERRGCIGCHAGGGQGRQDGGLSLQGSAGLMFRELTQEISPIQNVLRIDRENPENSLILTMPSREDPPDRHPNVTFATPQDPDFLIIRAWITEGALEN